MATEDAELKGLFRHYCQAQLKGMVDWNTNPIDALWDKLTEEERKQYVIDAMAHCKTRLEANKVNIDKELIAINDKMPKG